MRLAAETAARLEPTLCDAHSPQLVTMPIKASVPDHEWRGPNATLNIFDVEAHGEAELALLTFVADPYSTAPWGIASMSDYARLTRIEVRTAPEAEWQSCHFELKTCCAGVRHLHWMRICPCISTAARPPRWGMRVCGTRARFP